MDNFRNVMEFLAMMLVALPILGVTLIVTARFGLRPIVDAVLRLREGMESRSAPPDPARLSLLEDELREVRSELRQLRQVTDFMAQLAPGAAPAHAGTASAPHPLHIEPRTAPEPPAESFEQYSQEYL